jgi:hypothetical protein
MEENLSTISKIEATFTQINELHVVKNFLHSEVFNFLDYIPKTSYTKISYSQNYNQFYPNTSTFLPYVELHLHSPIRLHDMAIN